MLSGFGFAEYEDPDSALRSLTLLQGIELPALEDGCANKKLLIKADEKTRLFLDAYSAQKMRTDEKYVIPPHLHDLQEADLPETQRGLVISEIAQFRERAAKREREKVREVRDSIPNLLASTPSGPKLREWGKSQSQQPSQSSTPAKGLHGKGSQGFNKPVNFVKAEDGDAAMGAPDDRSRGPKTDEELERDWKEARRRDEEVSFKR
ncbi:hypothetical protein PAXRUDRAFT_29233, partial [Paxillus rubicundulus Ve08.2h10]